MEDFVTRHYRLFFGIFLATIVILAFYVGMLEGKRSGGSSVILSCTDEALAARRIPASIAEASAASKASTLSTGMFAGSKNGTKYYAPGCAGLDRIKPENIIWFTDAEDATLQGYTAAAC